MKETLAGKRFSVSFEVFPPKNGGDHDRVFAAAEAIAALRPSFVSVTFGAGGAGSRYTEALSRDIVQKYHVQVLPHMTCVGLSREECLSYLRWLSAAGIRSVMALRGDLKTGMKPSDMAEADFPHASDLVKAIRAEGGFTIGAACYPEVHPESANLEADLVHLKEKTDAGADFLTTQMFFDNAILYRFLWKAREKGISVPIFPGIMPITSASQVERAIHLSGCSMPERFLSLVDRFGRSPEAMKQAGIAYATDQIIDLFANGITNVHVYTMNKPDVAAAMMRNLQGILGTEA